MKCCRNPPTYAEHVSNYIILLIDPQPIIKFILLIQIYKQLLKDINILNYYCLPHPFKISINVEMGLYFYNYQFGMNSEHQNGVQSSMSQQDDPEQFPKTKEGILAMIRQENPNLALHFFQAYSHVKYNKNANKAFLSLTLDQMKYTIDMLRFLATSDLIQINKNQVQVCINGCEKMLEQAQAQQNQANLQPNSPILLHQIIQCLQNIKGDEELYSEDEKRLIQSAKKLFSISNPQKSGKQFLQGVLSALFPLSSAFNYYVPNYLLAVFIASIIIFLVFHAYIKSEQTSNHILRLVESVIECYAEIKNKCCCYVSWKQCLRYWICCCDSCWKWCCCKLGKKVYNKCPCECIQQCLDTCCKRWINHQVTNEVHDEDVNRNKNAKKLIEYDTRNIDVFDERIIQGQLSEEERQARLRNETLIVKATLTSPIAHANNLSNQILYLISIAQPYQIYHPIYPLLKMHNQHLKDTIILTPPIIIRVMNRQRGMATRTGINKQGWQTSDFPVACDRCYGQNPYMRMLKQHFGQECRICFRPFTVFKWKGNQGIFKRTCVCQFCSKQKNICQVCTLDLEFGLPMDIRDKRCGKNGVDLLNEDFVSRDNQKAKPPPPACPPPEMTKAIEKELVFVPELNPSDQEDCNPHCERQGALIARTTREKEEIEQRQRQEKDQYDQKEQIAKQERDSAQEEKIAPQAEVEN